MNLLEDSWIPVKTKQGQTKIIAVYEIVQEDVIGLNAPRADFNAALMQFLIGLLQTVFAPENPMAWRQHFQQPPTEDELKIAFESIKHAFYLDGEGARFMQDSSIQQKEKLKPIEEMIFGAPGESTKIKNKDHFVKKKDIDGLYRSCGAIDGLCYSCTASAILAANFFADNGGNGYFESMRGNGFISTLVCLDETKSEPSLWKNIWLNVMTSNYFTENNKDKFLWMSAIQSDDEKRKDFSNQVKELKAQIEQLDLDIRRTTDKTQKKELTDKKKELSDEQRIVQNARKGMTGISSADAHPLQVYWAWLRRFYLDIKPQSQEICSVCNERMIDVKEFYKTNQGYNYPKALWTHPLSPYKKAISGDYEGKFLPLEMTKNGLPYTYWNDFTRRSDNQFPAQVISQHITKPIADEMQLIICSFGYAMDSNSPLGWYEAKTPLYLIENENENENSRERFEAEIEKYIVASNKIADARSGYLIYAIKNAWFDENKEKNKTQKKAFDSDKADEVAKSFWHSTEQQFYVLVKELYDNVNGLSDEKRIALATKWYMHIQSEAILIFNQWAFKAKIQTNPKRIAIAYNQLMRQLNGTTLKHETLGLPKESKQ